MRIRILVGMALMTGVVVGAGPLLAETPAVGKKANVSLVPSVAGVVPGKPFDMAIHFELESGWHIYWQNSGDAGLPPVVRWKLPDGFESGELQFPAPKREVSPGDIVTNILKGDPSLLVEVRPPAAIASASVSIAGRVSYLVCAANCIREEADLSVDLPVRPAGSETESANEAFFARTRRSLPKPSNKVVSVTPSVTPDPLASGSKFEFTLKVEIAKGHHIQSDRPTLPSLIAADVFTERVPGIRFGKSVYPPPLTRKDQYLGDLTEFAGTFTVRIPGDVELAHESGPVRFGGVFAFQACTDGGNCLPPDAISFSLPVDVSASSGGAGGGVTTPPVRSGDSGGGPAPASNTGAAQGAPSGSQAGASIVAASQGVAENTGGIDSFLKRFGLIGLLIGCFLYGLFINATPCVLPLLSIKVLGFVQQAHESRKRTLVLGLAFGAGVMVFFVILGLLAAAGTNILQFPAAVIGLGTVVMAMGLSMLGVFTLQPPTAATVLEASINKEGPLSSFGKGALAPVLGFACTGPLLAGAFGWATQQPPATAVLAFFFAGFGMASPYMLLGANPHWLSFLPRPGNWMIVFERIMGFLLLAMVISLLHPLVVLIGVEGLEWTLVFLVFVGLACWVLGQVTFTMSAARRWAYRTAAVALVVAAGGVIYETIFPLSQAVAAAKAERDHLAICDEESTDDLLWRPWSEQAVDEAVRSGKVAFVDFTAAYCKVCMVNKKVAINTLEVKEKLKALGAVTFRGDFSTGDEAIFAELQRHGRAGVPLNLIYPPGKPDAPVVLETSLSKDYLLQKLDEAGAGRSVTASLLGR
ncbi:MAG: protein-disulfide reductase DsbD family protein [Phycisphaerales bacterium]|nr:protein-disulfide reductase DsbD family protein [Phycisphaerales bacterium]